MAGEWNTSFQNYIGKYTMNMNTAFLTCNNCIQNRNKENILFSFSLNFQFVFVKFPIENFNIFFHCVNSVELVLKIFSDIFKCRATIEKMKINNKKTVYPIP